MTPSFGQLFREEVTRRWTGERATLFALALVGMLFVQIIASQAIRAPRGGGGELLVDLLIFARLRSPLVEMLLLPRRPGGILGVDDMVYCLLSPSIAVVHFLVPACAGMGLAADRKSGQARERIRAGASPRQVLLAHGLAAVWPGVLVCLAGTLAGLSYVAVTWAAGISETDPTTQILMVHLPFQDLERQKALSILALSTMAWSLDMTVLTCVSALYRRVFGALTACYFARWVVLGGLSWQLQSRVGDLSYALGAAPEWWLVVFGGLLALRLTCLGVTLPLALRALRRESGLPGGS